MIKATYKRKYLVGGLLTVAEGESMSIMEESVAAGRHGTGAIAENSHVTHKHWAERENCDAGNQAERSQGSKASPMLTDIIPTYD